MASSGHRSGVPKAPQKTDSRTFSPNAFLRWRPWRDSFSSGYLGTVNRTILPHLSQQNSASVASVATHTRTIGIIHPPPDVHTIAENTARFGARKGPEFEKRVFSLTTLRMPKLSFLGSSVTYHAHYQHRISKLKIQLQSSAQQTMTSQPADSGALEIDVAAPDMGGKEDAKADTSALFKPPACKVLEPPEAEQ